QLVIKALPAEDTELTLTAALSCGEASDTADFTVTVKAAAAEPPEEFFTVDEILEIMAAFADNEVSTVEYTVKGVATSSSYKSNYSSYTVWLQSDDGSTEKAFELYSVGMDASITEDYTAANALAGKTVTCKGYLQKYVNSSGTTYEMPFLKATLSPTGEAYTPAIKAVEETEFTDIQKVHAEKNALTVSPAVYTEASEATLPLTGSIYSDVSISWTSDSIYAVVSGNTLTVTLPETEDVTATLTATLQLNDASATKDFTLTIKAAAAEPPKAFYTVDEILEIMAAFADNEVSTVEYTVKGVATSSSYKSNYSSYTVWLQSDDGSTAKAFELYSVGMDASITEDYTAANALAGKTVTCKGYLQKYVNSSGTTYEMPFLKATLSPTGEAYTPTITAVEQ
ncbi:MAG: hypothetical protein J5496_02965, partial [Lachnospiraceae bacterium]|nr:hypothetical protein [Lachnospiraceae bacterium]